MRKIQMLALVCILAISAFSQHNQKGFTLVIHGGAGTILKKNMTPEREKAYLAALDSALQTGYKILEAGGSALEAVQATVMVMENSPLFNAGKGAVFTNEGKNELDAAIMDGFTLKAGSVAGIRTIKNPITAARAVMDKSEHVMMSGKGADQFAAQQGCEVVDPSYFYTEDRFRGLQRAKERDANKVDSSNAGLRNPMHRDEKYGTVGAVAVDKQGRLAAATSTGGMTNKKWGRIGDAPIIGSGTYANQQVAISCTGWGEYFIRLVMAKSIADRMEFGKQSLKDAANQLIMVDLPRLGGDGGLVAVDKNGNVAMPFCTEGMYRGYIRSNGQKEILIYK